MIKSPGLRLSVFLFSFFSCILTVAGQAGPPANYKKWLEEEVNYIITRRERQVFLELKTDRERAIFVEAFWKQRDPDSNTGRNEFREDHYRRLSYANEMFGRDTPRPGWRTDRGRIYIVLGPPINIEYYEDIMGVYPVQIWHYLGDPAYGLPVEFKIMFFRRQGQGEYVLYSPADHGPQALVQEYMANARDAREAYTKLAGLAPNLAQESLTLIPGELAQPGFPSLASTRLIATVFGLPQKRVADDYAEAIRRYKDFIEVDYTANYIQSDASLAVVRDASGFFFVHYSIEPKKITFEENAGGYVAGFELNGRVADRSGRTVFQFDRKVPVTAQTGELPEIAAKSVAVQDLFPLIPGEYTFDLLMKNTGSKEFTSFNSHIIIPAAESGPDITPLLLGYGLERKDMAGERVPFLAGGGQVLSQSRKTFTTADELVVFLQVIGLNDAYRKGARISLSIFNEGASVFTKEIDLEGQTGAAFDVTESIALRSFEPGYYEISAGFIDWQGQCLKSRKEIFEISPVASIPRPVIISRVMSGQGSEEVFFLIGLQFLASGDLEKARENLSKAFERDPSRLDFAVGYARALFAGNDFEAVTDVLSVWSGDPGAPAEVFSLLGRACHYLEKFREAAGYYENYLDQFGANIEILNYLGTCYYRLGNRLGARKAWSQSLELNPDQPRIKALVDSLGR